MEVVRNHMKGATEEEVRKILAQFDDDSYAARAKLEDQRTAQRDALLAKLATRRRMKEEVLKENAVAAELDRITKAQVGAN